MKKLLAGMLSLVMTATIVTTPLGESISKDLVETSLLAKAETSGDYEYEILKNGTVEITEYKGKASKVTIPSKIAGKKVVSIGESSFQGNANITSVKIPSDVTNIGEFAFACCDKLKRVKIEKGLKIISSWSFEFCVNLVDINLPYGIKSIGYSAFQNCEKLTTFKMPNSVTEIGGAIFFGCKSLKNVTLSNKIKLLPMGEVMMGTFGDCISLEKISIPSSVKTIERNTLNGCKKLKTITIPKTVTTIEDYSIGYNAYDKIKGFKIKCYKGTAGEKYAKDNGFAYELILDQATGLKASKNSTSSIKLTWSKVKDAKGYNVYQIKNNKWSKIKTVAGTSLTVSKLKAGTNYKFCVKPYGKNGSKTIYGNQSKTLTTSTTPAKVNFKLTAGKKKATVKWSKVTGASGYKVYYKTSKNGKWKLLKTANSKATSYTKTKLSSKKTYWFTVKAYRNANKKTYNGSFATKSVKIK